MNYSTNADQLRKGAGVADVNRLWKTLDELAPGPLQLVIQPGNPEATEPVLLLQLVEQSFAPDNVTPIDHVWAQKEFRDRGYLITYGQLFDLLITGYGRMTGALRDIKA